MSKTRRDHLLLKLVDVLYERNDIAFERGKFRVRGDSIELWPSYEEFAYRIEMWGDEIEQISIIKPVSGETIKTLDHVYIYPARHFVMPEDRIQSALHVIREELAQQLETFQSQGKLLEAQRLAARTRFDLEMLAEVGHCPGIENYSRPLSGKPPGATPDTLYDFFPDDFVTFVDESHVTVPQVRAMYAGRPKPQGNARRSRFSAAECPGQPPVEVRGMGRTHRSDLLCQRDAERL